VRECFVHTLHTGQLPHMEADNSVVFPQLWGQSSGHLFSAVYLGICTSGLSKTD